MARWTGQVRFFILANAKATTRVLVENYEVFVMLPNEGEIKVFLFRVTAD